MTAAKQTRKRKYRFIKIFTIVIIILLLGWLYLVKVSNDYPSGHSLNYPAGFFGVTFSKKFCAELGLDWKEVYLATINDLQVKEIRLPIYWDEIEKQEGVFDFTDYDYIVNEGAERQVKFIINTGWRLPRWPECHAPAWNNKNSLGESQEKVLRMLEAVVIHYRTNSNISYWQIENEPLLDAFGVCPPSDENFLKKEVALVRSLDSRPIMISASGELSLWQKEAKIGDVFGSTVYRVVWGKWTGYTRYPLPAWTYRLKADLIGLAKARRFVVELQAEPWVPRGNMIYLTKAEIDRSMSFEQFKANLRYAIKINFNKTYLWGVEWWYWESKNGDVRYWDLARTLFK